jgi:hypothetical protein
MLLAVQSSFPWPLLIGAAVMVTVLGFTARASKSSWERAERLAQRLGLVMQPAKVSLRLFYGLPSASGLIRNKPVRLFGYTTGSGKSQVTWRALSVAPRAHGGLALSLVPQGLGSKVRTWFGAKEVEVGDPAFDRAWFIQTNHPDFVVAALLPELRAKFTEASRGSRSPSLKVKDGVVVYAEKGRFDSESTTVRFEALADVVCDFADVVEIFSEGTR